MGNGVRIPSATEINQLIAEWNDWLSARTDSLLSLEERVRTAGNDSDVADVAAAFVARKAITDRLAEVAATAARDRAAATVLTTKALVDDMGGPVGNNLTDAARLLDAIVQRVEQHVNQREGQQVAEAATFAQAEGDLATAAKLSVELGMQMNHVAHLREQLAARTSLDATAVEAAAVRASLEAAAKERAALLQQWGGVESRLETLATAETRVREVAARCREKVVQAPPLAVPSVAAFEADLGDVSGLPWAAARARMTPVLSKLDRLSAALAEAERRFQAPLDRRDDLRGLLQAFADKASVSGVMESPQLDTLFREAKALLWAAPADIVAAASLVDQYVAAVNAKVKEVAR
mgnify:CR=1 FL=1